LTRALVRAYAALWAATVVGVLAGVAGVQLIKVGTPHDALPASLSTARGLLAGNALVVLWPLALVALDWPRIPVARAIGDVVVAGQLLGHGLLVGDALGQRPGLWRYLPHLPIEWLAIALPVAAWLAARRDPTTQPRPSVLIAVGVLAALTLVLAAVYETYLVPIA
jgi:hypothetical protein